VDRRQPAGLVAEQSVASAVVIAEPPSRLVPIPSQNPNIDT